ncbi:MAG: hypothetical protein HKN40_05750 [Winogradskyella sp.]|uniref:hypothetical protein n=1 Tax=Winogradskyella sp. TaxID=1883156 RepID=UPI0018336CC7|nr:hypothetical protein [Winogradskyella sp.]
MFIQGLRNNLAKIGIDIMPYYYFISTKDAALPQKIRVEKINSKVIIFNETDLKMIKPLIKSLEQKDLLKDIKNGDICMGIKHNNEFVSYYMVKNKSFYFRKRFFPLNDNEIYIHSMYTFNKYRGKNISPYMIYERYKLFEKQGIVFHHSITEYFNKSALRIQKKLNSKTVALYLNIVLFKKWTFNYTLKNYI